MENNDIYETEYKNLSYKELFTMIDAIKPNLLKSYTSDIYEFYDYLCSCKKFLQEIHNKICADLSKKFGFEIKPTLVAAKFADINSTFFENGSILMGEYLYNNNIVLMRLLVNLVDSNNYQLKKINDNWTIELINSLFHETFHYVQFMCYQQENISNKDALLIKKYSEANLFCDYESSDVFHKYMCNMLELDARKFALESLENFNEKDLPQNAKDYFNDEYFSETSVMGNKFEYLKTAQKKYKLANMNYPDEDYKPVIDEFFDIQQKHYLKMQQKANETTKQNLSILPKCSFIDTLSITQINALTHDYKNYLNSTDKNQFLKSIEKTNEIIDSNIPASEKNNKDYKLNKFKSFLPEYLNELNKEKNNSTEKE